MYAEFSQVSLHSMSNSELILVKDETESMEFDILKRPPLEFELEEEFCEATAIYNSSNDDRGRRQVQEDGEGKKGEESKAATSMESEKKNICLAEFKATVDYDDDGFKTPTSLDQKIPEMKQCPPAPRKPKANKRRTSASTSTAAATASTCGNLQLDLSQVVESWFSASLVDDLHRKVKKARTQEV
ncbi:hypothetical protein HRI_000647000 [Hibiscus trionum]|uniref:Uncharacterized protein n=1 Tax=Hibiscus trionum TaxID=183268 RepID=A0A9W7H328_HIBTR|nr:hypothetical protein HRI_000647000 [Hibiscus trionum]